MTTQAPPPPPPPLPPPPPPIAIAESVEVERDGTEVIHLKMVEHCGYTTNFDMEVVPTWSPKEKADVVEKLKTFMRAYTALQELSMRYGDAALLSPTELDAAGVDAYVAALAAARAVDTRYAPLAAVMVDDCRRVTRSMITKKT